MIIIIIMILSVIRVLHVAEERRSRSEVELDDTDAPNPWAFYERKKDKGDAICTTLKMAGTYQKYSSRNDRHLYL